MTNNSGIYAISNTTKGDLYIGSATNIHARWRQHKHDLLTNKHHSKRMQNSWNKNGECYFEFKVLLRCNQKDLLMYEQIYLDFYHPAYNSAKVAGSPLGVKRSDATKAKLSAVNKGRKHTKEAIDKISNAGKGRILKDDVKQKISDSHKGKKKSKEHCLNISKALNGRVLSPETIAKRSETQRNQKRKITEEHRQKLINANIGKKASTELKKKLSDAHKGVPWSTARRLAEERKKADK